jgi:fatty acid desaturase
MKENIPLLNFMRSNKFILYVALFTVLFLAPNTYFVFHSFSIFISPYREIISAGVALIVASSIMIFTLRKNVKMAAYYALFEVSISAYYYIAMVIGWDWGLIPALSFTVVLPLSVYHYTREIDVDIDFTDKALNKWLEANPGSRPSDYFKKKH